jgi:CheY-like chemotaxis protein/anti-sigma regulatory factor (Ser/Thr protein kinase)
MSAARLLVVDDEEVNREIIAEYLDGSGYELIMANDGEGALALLFGATAFDAVVLDRMMPGIDGLEVLRRIQAEPRLRTLPVIMQTAAASREQVAEGLRLGAYYYLTKPYHNDSLVAVVRSALDMVHRRRELTRDLDRYRGVIGVMQEGRFRVRELKEAQALAAAVSTLAADPSSAAMGLSELLINAIEHGNLGISFHEKASLLAAERLEREIEERLALPANAGKFVEVHITRAASAVRVAIRDQGRGFDWRRYLTLDESRALYPNGRGIAMARHIAFRTLEYVDPGNEVVVAFAASA